MSLLTQNRELQNIHKVTQTKPTLDYFQNGETQKLSNVQIVPNFTYKTKI